MRALMAIGLIALAIVAGALFQSNGRLDQLNSTQMQTIADQKQQIADQADAVAETASLKDQLVTAQSDANAARSARDSLQNQTADLTRQLAARDQIIRQDQAQLQQLSATYNSVVAELNDVKTKYAAAEAQLQPSALQSPIMPVATPVSLPGVYPTRSLLDAKAMEAAALAAQQAAADQVDAIAKSLRTQFEALPQYVQAKGNLDACQSAYDIAKQTVLVSLHGTPEFLAAADAKAAAEKAVVDARDSGESGDDLSTLAQQSLAAGTAVSNLETTALASSSDYQDAKTKLADARDAMKQLEDQFQGLLASNGAYQQAKANLDAAVANHNLAQSNLAALLDDKDNRAAAEAEEQRQSQLADWHQQNQQNIQNPNSNPVPRH
jgi:chromosome segregation ATPase